MSIFLENDVLSDPPVFAPKIEYFTHENTYEQIEPFFPGGNVVTAKDVEAELRRIHHMLKPMYLLERGVRLTGTDGWS